jgi:hypothetical protein
MHQPRNRNQGSERDDAEEDTKIRSRRVRGQACCRLLELARLADATENRTEEA